MLNIKIVDGTSIQDTEVLAMLQAFYSRSPMAIEERLKGLTSEGAGETKQEKIKKALKTYYVDYGHASIGDCASTTVFIENVSMLAAKAIQDTPLYSGQECSTRYLDFSSQPFITGAHQIEVSALQAKLRELYLRALPAAKALARTKYAVEDVVSSKIPTDKIAASYEKTLDAIAFDYCRSLLPAGAVTSLSWTGSLRSLNDHLHTLAGHYLEEVRNIAVELYTSLQAAYPSSFKTGKLTPYTSTAYASTHASHYYSADKPLEVTSWTPSEEERDQAIFLRTSAELQTSGRGRSVTDHVQYYKIRGLLDFGSFRDLQRHRNGFNLLPSLTTEHGFSPYHMTAFVEMDKFSPGLSSDIDSTLLQVRRLDLCYDSPDVAYAIPLGFKVPVNLVWSNGQLEYVLRLRSSTSVHPTLRDFIFDLESLASVHALGLSDFWSLDRRSHYCQSDRGEQDIKRAS